MKITGTKKKQWTLVHSALVLPRPLAVACALFGLIALAGYFGNIEALYRPIAGGPATHPLTALSVLFLGLGIYSNNRTRHGIWFQRLCVLVAIWITVSRLWGGVFNIDLSSWITPFQDKVLLDRARGGDNSMGSNTAVMLLSIAVALGLYSLKLPKSSQIVASLAIAIPAVSFTGYAYGLENFYGQMSLLTATAGLGLASAAFAMTADHGGLRALLSPYVGGKLARAQVLAGYLIPTGIGYVAIKIFLSKNGQTQGLFGIFVVAICWFIILMVTISAFFLEKIDFLRRQMEAELEAAALSDALTGLPNRRMFFERGQQEVEHIRRSGGELWILMLDLDRFKNINDTAGHAIGDRVLVAVAALLSQSLRKVDLLGRLGGEEFAILLADTNRHGCMRVAQTIRQNVESLIIPGWTDIHGSVTISIGCSRLDANATLDTALHAADQALYDAKNSGRNRVSMMGSKNEVSAHA